MNWDAPIVRRVASVWVSAVGGAMMAVAGLLDATGWKWALVLPGALLTGASAVAADRQLKHERQRIEQERRRRQEEKDRADARSMIRVVLDLASRMHQASRSVESQSSLRANIMVVDGEALRIGYHTGGYSAAEQAMRWHRGQGCCGLAWESGRTMSVAEGQMPTADPADPTVRPWGMTDEQRRITAHLGSVISAPIFLPHDPGRVVAILNFDDALPPGQSRLDDPEVRDVLEHSLARRLGVLLGVAEGDLPEA